MKSVREAVTLLGVFGPVMWLCVIWRSLPVMLPSHFGLDGTPNAYASRNVVWAIVGISVVMYFSMLVLQRFPHRMNLPRPPGDPERKRMEALGVEMIGWLRLELAWTFAYLLWEVVEVGTHHSEGLGTAFLFVSIGVTMATIAWFVVRMKRPASKE